MRALREAPTSVSAPRLGTARLFRPATCAVVATVTAGLLLGSCGRGEPDRRRVAATVFPLFDLVRRVAGDRFDVRLVLPSGLDPHGYDPRPRDVAALAEASLVFAVGLGLDPWAQGLARCAGAGTARVFELGPLMDPILAPAGMIGKEPPIDPHFWTDAVRAQQAVDVIAGALEGLDPEGGPFFRERAERVKRSIQAVDREVRDRSLMWTRRRIVTFHGSLFYFAARYGLQVVGVVEAVPGTEPTAQHFAQLVGLLEGPEPAVLFTEPQLDGQVARALARETGAVPRVVDVLGGQPPADSYEGLLRGIARSMDEALR
jgi:zinc transport system substrate-binding protein